MKNRSDRLFLYDILECCDRVEEYVNGATEAGFRSSRMLQDALVRNIEVIGEAVKNPSAELKAEHPEIAWSQIARMRDKIAHHYFRINPDVVWETATGDVANLKPRLQVIYDQTV